MDIKPRSPVEVIRLFGGIFRLHLKGIRVSQARTQLTFCLAYSSTLKLEAIEFSATLVGFHRTTRHYVPENRTLQSFLKLCFSLMLVTDSVKRTPVYEP
jgi:hypothetical protein